MMTCRYFSVFSVLFAILLSISFISAWTCYQESANILNQTGGDGFCGLNYSGNYSVEPNYFYVNYSIPSMVNSALWMTKHGSLGIYNSSIPSECISGSIVQLRFYSNWPVAGTNYTSYGECYNHSWINFTSFVEMAAPFTCASIDPSDVRAFLYDGNWNTGTLYTENKWYNPTPSGCANHRIYEEAVIWNFSDNVVFNCGILDQANTAYTLQNNITDYSGTCFNITADNVTLDLNGFTVDGNQDSSAIYYGIYATGRNNIFVKNGVVKEFGDYYCSDVCDGDGLYFSGVNNSLVQNVTLTNNFQAAILSYSFNNIFNNMFFTTSSGNGLTLSSSSNNTFYNISTPNNNYGLSMSGSSNNNIFYNIISTSNSKGISLSSSSNNTFYNTTLISNTDKGLSLSSSSNNTFYNTTSMFNDYGTILSGGSNNNFYTILISNNYYGFSLSGSSNNIIYNLTSTLNNDNGISLSGSSNNIFYNAFSTSNNFGGVALSGSSDNNFFYNLTSTLNAWYGLTIVSSSNNTFVNLESYSNPDLEVNNWGTGSKLVYNNSYGQIRFISLIGGVAVDHNLTFPGNIQISNNSAYVNSTAISELNVSANITLYGVGDRGFIIPKIFKDSAICLDCYNFTSLTASTVMFNVSSWSNYSIKDATQLTSCGTLDQANTVYTLRNNVSTIGTCFTISADNVTLDLNGYTVAGDNSGTDYGVYANGRKNISIKNGVIGGSGAGFMGGGVYFVNMNNSRIENCILKNNEYGVYLSYSSNNTISNLSAYFSVQQGMFLSYSSNNTISNLSAYFSVQQGMFLSNSLYNFVYNADLFNSTNGEGLGLLFSPSNEFFNLNTTLNAYQGVKFMPGSTNNIFYNLASYLNSAHAVYGTTSDTIFIFNNSYGQIAFGGLAPHVSSDIRFGVGQAIQIANNSVYVNTTAISELNVSANITLYGIGDRGFIIPKIFKDSAICLDCYNFTSLTASTVIFNVSSWSNYSIGESARSGDGICTALIGENCGNTADCGCSSGQTCTNNACVTSTTGGSPGGSTGSINLFKTYFFDFNQFQNGYTQNLKKGDQFKFDFKNETHYVLLNNISNQTIQIEIHSTVKIINLTLGQSQKVDLDNNGYYDFSLSFDSLVDGAAKVTIRSLNESVSSSEINRINNQTVNHCNNTIKDSDEVGIDCGGGCVSCNIKNETLTSYKLIWKIIIFVVLVGLFVGILILVRIFKLRKGEDYFKQYNLWKKKGYNTIPLKKYIQVK